MMLDDRAGLTPRLRDCYRAIEAHIVATGCSPSLNEIRAKLGLSSKGRVHRMVEELEARGWITTQPGRWRSIALTRDDRPQYALSPEIETRLRLYCSETGNLPATIVAHALNEFLTAQRRSPTLTSKN